MTVRAIEHVGITVPDLEQVTRFFVEEFGETLSCRATSASRTSASTWMTSTMPLLRWRRPGAAAEPAR